MPTKDQINAVVWKACDTFLGIVAPSEYKNYILTFLFIKSLSDIWKDKKKQYMKARSTVEKKVRDIKRGPQEENFLKKRRFVSY